MKKFKRIWFKNISNHKDTVIDLDGGLNVIVGDSDSGKSAIIEGLGALVYNEPMNINWHETRGEIGCELEDGSQIIRVRIEELSRKKCLSCGYKFTKPITICPECSTIVNRKKIDDYFEINGKRSLNAGTDILPEVEAFFNMPLFKLDDKKKISLNIFKKDEVQSFVDISGRERMVLIGEMGDSLLVLDSKMKILRDIKSGISDDLKESQKTQKYLQQQKKKLKEFYKECGDKIDVFYELYKTVTEQSKHIEQLKEQFRNFKTIFDKQVIYDIEIQTINTVHIPVSEYIHSQNIIVRKDIYKNDIQSVSEQLSQDIKNLLEVVRIYKKHRNVPAEVKTIAEVEILEVMTLYESLKHKPDFKDVTPVESIDIISNMEFLKTTKTLKLKTMEINIDMEETEEELQEVLDELSKIDICPLCNSKYDISGIS